MSRKLTLQLGTIFKQRVTRRSSLLNLLKIHTNKTFGDFIGTISYLRKSLVREVKITSLIDNLMIDRDRRPQH